VCSRWWWSSIPKGLAVVILSIVVSIVMRFSMPSDIRIYTVSLLRDTLIWFLVAIAICFAIAGLTGFVKIMARIAIWLTIIAIALRLTALVLWL
jgi:hypothetical protein